MVGVFSEEPQACTVVIMAGGKMEKLGWYLAAVSAIVLGIQIILHPVYYAPFRARYIDLTGFNIPLGLGFIIIGIVILLPRRKKK